jgi:MoxR-like ATPase
METKTLQKALARVGYIARQPELLAVLSALRGSGKAFLLEGAPGCGKTALAEAVAKLTGAPLVFHQCHAWTDDQELFVGIDVASAVAGEADHVRQDGVLAHAAKLSQDKGTDFVVVCLDEIDKCSERTEALLLDWLQSGRVPVAPGVHVQTDLSKVLVFFTSNDQRALGDAFMRRVRRVRMQPLPVKVLDSIVVKRTGAPQGLVTVVSKAARDIAQSEGNVALSLQEIAYCVTDILASAGSVKDVYLILAQWAARTSEGAGKAKDHKMGAAIWGEVNLARGKGKQTA